MKGKTRQWSFAQIQKLELTSKGEVFVTLYPDVGREMERDERLHFLTKCLAGPDALAAALRSQLGERFALRFAMAQGAKVWRSGAKLLRGRGGPEGDFVLKTDGWRFISPERGPSIHVEDRLTANVSSCGDLRLTVATHGGQYEYEFQLKSPLPRDVYGAWWHRLNGPRGLELIEVKTEPSR